MHTRGERICAAARRPDHTEGAEHPLGRRIQGSHHGSQHYELRQRGPCLSCVIRVVLI